MYTYKRDTLTVRRIEISSALTFRLMCIWCLALIIGFFPLLSESKLNKFQYFIHFKYGNLFIFSTAECHQCEIQEKTEKVEKIHRKFGVCE